MKNGGRSIYVRIDIRGSIDRVWHLTQTPAQHLRWDIRFSEIDYLPKPDSLAPQQFTYLTRIGLGLSIRGLGETVSNYCAPDGARASALRFWSDDRKSLIREGSGFWKYVPREGAVRFLTRYDYDVRFGIAGRAVDRWVFRPLMGWATAWSFDRLRMWIERGLEPDLALRLSLIYTAARAGVALVWTYHGLVPKLLSHDADELAMLSDAGLPSASVQGVCAAIGAVEVAFGMVTLVLWRSRWPLWLTLIAMTLATSEIAACSPRFLTSAFNALTLNMSTALLAMVALLTIGVVPFASRCARDEPNDEPVKER